MKALPLFGQQLWFYCSHESRIISKSIKFSYCFAKISLNQINRVKASRVKHRFYSYDLALFLTSCLHSCLRKAAAVGRGCYTTVCNCFPFPTPSSPKHSLELSYGSGTSLWTTVYFSCVLPCMWQLCSAERTLQISIQLGCFELIQERRTLVRL